jgi:competence ComEA-like helix-hairpin-helix protein
VKAGPGRFGRRGVLAGLVWAASVAAVSVWDARAEEQDPNLPYVQVVCGRCHTIEIFRNKPRSWERWNDVFADMTKRGANGTDEQLAAVTTYFLENLTLINVNTSLAEELAGVLGVADDVADAIIARRQRRPFTGLEQLREVPGVDPAKLEQRKSRIQF